MKKFLPIIALTGISCALLTGCSNNITAVSANLNDNINEFVETVDEYTNEQNQDKIKKTVLNKYTVNIDSSTTDTINNSSSSADDENIVKDGTSEDNNEVTTLDEKETNSEISTLYYLSNDIENSCEEFCELKEEITEAIVETENLIKKLNSKDIELSREERLFISEQSTQLKNLGRQLANITTELNFNLSDLQQVLNENNSNLNDLSLKYLIVLDNLVNGNEMLQSGLSSLNIINHMFNSQNSVMAPNNVNKIVYGFQQNNNPPVIKEYSVDNNGELVENKIDNTANKNNNANQTVESSKNTNIDTYNKPFLKSNIDTYGTNNPKNIDSFFNTALLDNEFMYGNNSTYGYGYNPYMMQYANYEQANKNNIDSNANSNNTQYIDNKIDDDNEKEGNKEYKKFKLKSNIDTYKDENAPTLKAKFKNIKEKLGNIFAKISTEDNKEIKNPIYRL